MSKQVTRQSVAGRVYLDLRKLARRQGRPTHELFVLYALERLLYRASISSHKRRLVLKGGLLMAAFSARRATKDIDWLARSLTNDAKAVGELVADIASMEHDDGVEYSPVQKVSEIREEDVYAGVRVRLPASIASAKVVLSVDVNFGDKVVPAPEMVSYPALLEEDFSLLGYPLAAVLGEKLETVLRRGDANTRWRDFADILLLARSREVSADSLRSALATTASQRGTPVVVVEERVAALGNLGREPWSRYRREAGLEMLPAAFEEVVDEVRAFANPVLQDSVRGARWDPTSRAWMAT